MKKLLAAGVAGIVLGLAGMASAETSINVGKSEMDYLDALYIHLHENPELSNKEFNTSKRIAAEWEKAGYDVTTGVGGTGIVAVLKNGDGPTLMMRTDLDALPLQEKTGVDYASHVKSVNQAGQDVSVMHACGHDIHMTTLTGTARYMAAHKDEWSGTLVLIGQPAEELGKGARQMLEDGLYSRFPKPDFNVALHDNAAMPAGKVGYVPGYALANVDSVDIIVHGIGGHGAYPQATKDPVVIGASIVLALQTIVSRELAPDDPAVVTVGSFHSGTKHNIISDEARMQLTVRSYSDETRNHILASIKRIAVNEAKAFGISDDNLPEVIVKDEYTPSTYNDPELTERIAETLISTLGKDNVVKTKPVMGGEDFSQYGRTDDNIPSVIFWLGAVDPKVYAQAKEKGMSLPSLHSPFFKPDYDLTIKTGIEAESAIALNLLAKKD